MSKQPVPNYFYLAHMKKVIKTALREGIINERQDDRERVWIETVRGMHIDWRTCQEYIQLDTDIVHEVINGLTIRDFLEFRTRRWLFSETEEYYHEACKDADHLNEIDEDKEVIFKAFDMFNDEHYQMGDDSIAILVDEKIEEIGWYDEYDLTYIWEKLYDEWKEKRQKE